MSTFYWRGGTGSFDLASGWQIADELGTLAPADQPPVDSDTAVVDITGITLSADGVFAGVLALTLPGAVGSFDLNGHSLTLPNAVQLGGLVSTIGGGGTLATSAVASVPASDNGGIALRLADGVSWINTGLVLETGVVSLGSTASDSATIINQPGALFGLSVDQTGLLTAAAASANFAFVNNGTLAKLGGTGISSLLVPVTNSGLIVANTGTLELLAGGVLGGSIGGDVGSVHLAGAFALPAGTSSVVNFAGDVQFGSAAHNMALLTGAGTLTSTGTVALTAWGDVQVLLGNGATWQNAGTVLAAADLGVGVTSGDSARLVNQPGALFAFTDDIAVKVFAPGGNYSFVNSGILSKTGGTQISHVGVAMYDTGQIVVSSGTLQFDAGGSFAGQVSGVGALAFGGGTATLTAAGTIASDALLINGGTLIQAGAVMTPGSVVISNGLLQLANGRVAAAGLSVAIGTTVQGYGTLATPIADSGFVRATGGTLAVTGSVTGTGFVEVAADAVLRLGASGHVDSSVTTVNSGTVLATSGDAGTIASGISAAYGSTGVLKIAGGSLTLAGPVDGSQSIQFSGTGGTLTIADLPSFAPSGIQGFVAGDAIQVVDSASNVLARLDMLETLAASGMLTSIQFTNAGTPGLGLTASQLSDDAQAIAKIVSPYRLLAPAGWRTDVSGVFDDPTRWASGTVPDVASDASIDFADRPTVLFGDAAHQLHSLTNTAGRFVMAGGTLDLGGLDNGSDLRWTGGTIVLDGDLTVSPRLSNAAGAEFSIVPGGQRLSGVGGGGPIIANAGTILVDGGAGIASFDVPLVNIGSVMVAQGTLAVNAGGTSDAGSLQVGPGGTLLFGTAPEGPAAARFVLTGGQYSAPDTVISGTTLDAQAASGLLFGRLRLSAGGLVMGTLNAQVDSGLTQSAVGDSPILSGSGTLTVFNGGNLVGGVQSGSGLTRLIGTSVIGGLFQLDDGRTVENNGWLNWSSGSIALGANDPDAVTHSGTLTNVAGATFYVTANGRIANPVAGASHFANAGVTAVFAGTGETDIDAFVDNPGFIQVQSGTLSLNGGGSSDGAHLYVTSGAVVQFGGLPGDMPGGTFSIASGPYAAGSTAITGATLDVSTASGAMFVNQLRLTAGALLLGSQGNAVVQGALLQSGGLLRGSELLAVYGGAALTGGAQSGPAITRLIGTSVIGGSFQLDGGRTVENDGWMNWSSGNITLGTGDAAAVTHAGTLANVSGATLYVTADGRISAPGVGSGVVNNAGVIAVFAGAGRTDIDAVLNNTGGLQVQSGVLSLNGGGTSNAGNLYVAPTAVLQFGTVPSTGLGGSFNFTGGPYVAGNTMVQAGTVDLSAVSGVSFGQSLSLTGGSLELGGNFPFTDGFTQSGGVLSGTGYLYVTRPAQLSGGVETGSGRTALLAGGAIQGAVQFDGGRSIENDGTLTWSGAPITLGGGDVAAATHSATLINAVGAVMEIQGNGTINGAGFPGLGVISNAGTILQQGGIGTTTVFATLYNSGVVVVTAGTLALEQSVVGAGTFLLDGAATLDFAAAVTGGATLSFLHAGGTLEVDTTGSFGATIAGFMAGDTIDARAVGFVDGTTSAGFSAGTLTLSDGTHSAAFSLTGSYTDASFSIASDGHGGTVVLHT